MNEQTRGQKWLLFGFFAAIGLFFMYFILFVASGKKVDPRYSRTLPADRFSSNKSVFEGKFVLEKDRPFKLGNLQMTYRGLETGEVVLDVVVIALDPNYAYRHYITKENIGVPVPIRIAGEQFSVRSASQNRLSLIQRSP
jgi:hypothetical protein